MKKLFFLISHPIQYYVPWFIELNKQMPFEVLYCSDETIHGYVDKQFGTAIKWDTPLLDGYSYSFMKNNSFKPSIYNGFMGLLNLEIVPIIWKNRKQGVVFVHGWDRATYILMVVSCWLFGMKYIIHAENPLNQELRKSKINRGVKQVVLRVLLKNAYKVAYIGQQNKAFFKYYGAIEDQLIFTPYSVDNNTFDHKYQQLLSRKQELQSTLLTGINAKKIILFSGKLIDKKRPMDLLRAFALLNDPQTGIVFMGDGALRAEMEAFIKENNVTNCLITGFVNQSKVSDYFVCADIFALPSGDGETWGLVVNEAMNFGLPLVCSDAVGSTYDLIQDNGLIYPCGDIDALKTSLQRLIHDAELCTKMGKRSKEIIANYSNEVRANNLIKSLN